MADDFLRKALGLSGADETEEPVLMADGGEKQEGSNQDEDKILEEIDADAEDARNHGSDEDTEPSGDTPGEHEPYTPDQDGQDGEDEPEPATQVGDGDGEQIIDDNVEARRTDRQRGRESAEGLRDHLEDAADLEGERKQEILDKAVDLGSDIHEKQGELEALTQQHVDFTAQRKTHLEEMYGEREAELTYSEDDAAGYVDTVTEDFVSSLETAAINRGFFKLQFREIKSQNDLYSQDTGQINQGFLEAGQRAKKFAHHFEGQMDDATSDATEQIGDLLDLVQLEEQAEELTARKDTYDRIVEDVNAELETIRNADTDIDQGGYGDKVWGALGNLIDTLDEDVDSDLLAEFNFDLSEYGDPERALHTLRATAADGLKLQQERLYETIDVVNDLRDGLQDSIQTYESFVEDVETLENIAGVGGATVEQLQALGIETATDLADETVSDLRIMSDDSYLRNNADDLVEHAETYLMNLASSYGLSELTPAMDEDWDDSTTHDAMVRNQVKGLYESADQVTNYLSQALSETPDADAYTAEWGGVDAPEWIDSERNDVYGELDIDVPEMSDIDVF